MEELKRKNIQFKVLPHDSENDAVLVLITGQSHRGDEFGADGENEFVASNGLHLFSQVSPAVPHPIKDYGVYVRGDNSGYDDNVLVFNNRDDFLIFKQAVNDYNRFDFGKQGISQETIKKTKGKIKQHVEGTIREINLALRDLDGTETAEKILAVKRRIMYIFTDLPLTSDCCPYCLHYNYQGENETCVECDYGKRKGICRKEDSKFKVILNARNRLRDAINNY